MHNQENPNIFCQNCGKGGQPSAQPNNRTKVIIHDREENEHYYLALTEGQVNLLRWLDNQYIFDTDRFSWETVGEMSFEEV